MYLVLAASACGGQPRPATDLQRLPWDSVLSRARGTVVTWRMWRGDPSINRFVDGWAAPRLLARYGVTLRAVEGQGAEMINQLGVERQVGGSGSADLLWINGETFGGLRKEGLLYGPWSSRLPNSALASV